MVYGATVVDIFLGWSTAVGIKRHHEPHHEEEHVKISEFQSCRWGMAQQPDNKRQIHGFHQETMTYFHLFSDFQTSAISRVLNLTCSLSWWGSFMKFMLINIRYFRIRPITFLFHMGIKSVCSETSTQVFRRITPMQGAIPWFSNSRIRAQCEGSSFLSGNISFLFAYYRWQFESNAALRMLLRSTQPNKSLRVHWWCAPLGENRGWKERLSRLVKQPRTLDACSHSPA